MEIYIIISEKIMFVFKQIQTLSNVTALNYYKLLFQLSFNCGLNLRTLISLEMYTGICGHHYSLA